MKPFCPVARLCCLLLVHLLLACGSSDDDSGGAAEPTICGTVPPPGAESGLSAAGVPIWYDDAKLGIMIHWGIWTIPGWAETTLDPERVADPDDPLYLLAPGGAENFLRHNPYTEWYENSLAIDGTATQEYHRATYGDDFAYTEFEPLFEEESRGWRADDWARLFAQARARYVVFVSKHHDGYVLWPSEVENPSRAGWYSERDIVGELTGAVRERCLRMGLYYSGGIDWSFKGPPLETALDFLLSVPEGEPYAEYFDAQYRELIERHRPAVLWNDISAPAIADLDALFADYRAAVPDGVVNDRWGFAELALPPHYRSVEYDVSDEITADKWEAVRGIGKTFGFNRNQPLEDYGTPEDYIRLLIDVVSKNGNLLLNVGPMADGTIPAPQVEVLRALGSWLDLYGDAIFATRPWQRHGGATAEGIDVRFTRSGDGNLVYAILLDTPATESITLLDFAETPTSVRLLGSDEPLQWERVGTGLKIELPTALPDQPAHALAIAPLPAS
jgi:alpha-L-fucosidase